MDWTIFARYAAPIFALFVGIWLNKRFERRPKLVSFVSHAGAVQMRSTNQPPFGVHTHTVVIHNSGKLKAENVRLGHNVLPDFSIVPDVKFEVDQLPGGAVDLVFPTLIPKEQVTVTYLYYPPLLWSQVNTTLKSDEGFAQILQVLPTPPPPRWTKWLAASLMIVGCGTIAYGLVELVRFAIGL